MSASYGASPVRRRRSNAELASLDAAIVRAVEVEAPITLRGVYYRCVAAKAIDKTENDYAAVGRRLLHLRRAGEVSYHDITDGTRWITRPHTFDSVNDALTETARLYRRRLWTDSDVSLQLFTEKDAISGVILPITDRWDIPLGVLRGYVSESFAWSVAQSLNPTKTNVIAQLGDHDPSGVGAWQDFSSKVQSFADDEYQDVTFERLAVLPEQIEAMRLPTRPTKATDTRARNWIGESVEVDAIPPSTLRDIVEAWVSEHIDEDALRITQVAEASERQLLTALARRTTT